MDGSRTHDGAVPTRGITLDEATLDAFVRTHHARLTGLARLVCRDSTDAGDAVQSAFEQAWRHRGSLREPDALRAWLDRIVVREAIRQDRRRRSPLGWLFAEPKEIPSDVVDPHAQHDDAMHDLRSAYLALPAVQRSVVALHLYLGYSIAETAEVVGVPQETVRSRLRLAKQRLRQTMGTSDA
jgi:RNA polymerase sigma-70 factor, ECF subfamily